MTQHALSRPKHQRQRSGVRLQQGCASWRLLPSGALLLLLCLWPHQPCRLPGSHECFLIPVMQSWPSQVKQGEQWCAPCGKHSMEVTASSGWPQADGNSSVLSQGRWVQQRVGQTTPNMGHGETQQKKQLQMCNSSSNYNLPSPRD